MKLGVENKRSVWALSLLGVGLAYSVYSNFFSDSTPTAPSTPRSAVTAPSPSDVATPEEVRARRTRNNEFLPILHPKHPDKDTPPPPQDPTLRLDLLAKLDGVPAAGSGRDLFNFGKPAPEKLAGAEPVVKPSTVVGPPHLAVNRPKNTTPAGPAPPPPPPPINLKYYGICTTRPDGSKTAFFMDGDDILIAAEGATFKGRYRLLRIGVNSAVVEDLQYKHEQTLPLAEDAQGAGA